jgi:hypothetical protein
MARHVARKGRSGMHIGFSGKARRKIPLGRPRCRWVYNILMDLREIGWGGMDWIDRCRIGTSGGGLL